MPEVPLRSPPSWGSSTPLASKQKLAAARKAGERWFINVPKRQQPGSGKPGRARRRDKLAPGRYGQEDLRGMVLLWPEAAANTTDVRSAGLMLD